MSSQALLLPLLDCKSRWLCLAGIHALALTLLLLNFRTVNQCCLRGHSYSSCRRSRLGSRSSGSKAAAGGAGNNVRIEWLEQAAAEAEVAEEEGKHLPQGRSERLECLLLLEFLPADSLHAAVLEYRFLQSNY